MAVFEITLPFKLSVTTFLTNVLPLSSGLLISFSLMFKRSGGENFRAYGKVVLTVVGQINGQENRGYTYSFEGYAAVIFRINELYFSR